MSRVSHTVTNANFSALIGPGCVTPIAPAFPINLPLNFSACNHIKMFSGLWVPQDDYQYLQNQFSDADAPNWMIVVCDSQLNVSLTGTQFVSLAVQRFGFFSWINPANSLPTSLYLEGRIATPAPMLQNEPCNYLIVVGQGVVA